MNEIEAMPLYVSGPAPTAVPDADQEPAAGRRRWWTTPYGRWRLSIETEAMKRFPGFERGQGPYGHVTWTGSLRSSLPPGRKYVATVFYPDEFPDDAPLVAIVDPEFPPGTPHLLEGNRPCLYAQKGPRKGYDPGRTTGATLVAWTALWVHAYETWRMTGSWPGAEE